MGRLATNGLVALLLAGCGTGGEPDSLSGATEFYGDAGVDEKDDLDAADDERDAQEDEAPPAIPGRMTGGGSVFTAAGVRVTHGFELHCDPADEPNRLQINWDKQRFHLLDLTTASCIDDPAIDPEPPPAPFDTFIGTGTGRLNGVEGATIDFTFTDAGEPGVADTVTLVIRDPSGAVVLTLTDAPLNFGNQQAHAE